MAHNKHLVKEIAGDYQYIVSVFETPCDCLNTRTVKLLSIHRSITSGIAEKLIAHHLYEYHTAFTGSLKQLHVLKAKQDDRNARIRPESLPRSWEVVVEANEKVSIPHVQTFT
ncbi:hypothetical protein B0H14DRAFT_2652449 [Mycena olivaceomarginata]|nr:hypothetical protein B0H14DRAFT_2652449 [Mycena olivaceomarginata]